MKKIFRSIFKYMLLLLGMIILAIALGRVTRSKNMHIYDKAMSCFDDGDYKTANELFEKLGDFENSEEMALVSNDKYYLKEASQRIKENKYDDAVTNLNKIASTNESIIDEKNELIYKVAVEYYNEQLLVEAKSLFESIEEYKDANIYLAQIEVRTIDEKKEELYNSAVDDFNNGEYQFALSKFQDISGYEKADEYIVECEELLKRIDKKKTIAGGIINTVAITTEGKLLYTNTNNSEFLITDSWENLVSVDTYGELIVAIDKDGNLYTAGLYDNGRELEFNRTTECVDVATGERFAVALFNDGKVEAKGHNDDNQCNVEDWNKYNLIDVDAGWRFAVGLTSEGGLLFSGVCKSQEQQYLAERELWKDVVSISSSGGGESAVGTNKHGKGHTVGLRKDGTVVAIGDNTYGQCDVEEWTDIVRVSAGDWYTVGLKNDGTVLITGENRPRMKYIEEAMFEKTYEDVAAGYGQTIFITKDGQIDVYGFNDYKKQEIADSWNEIKVLRY